MAKRNLGANSTNQAPVAASSELVTDPTNLDAAQAVIEEELAAQAASIQATYDELDNNTPAPVADNDSVTEAPVADNDSVTEAPVVDPAPVADLTPAQRRDRAEQVWDDLCAGTINPTTDVIALFAAAPNPRTLLDTCYGRTVRFLTSDPAAIDAVVLGRIATLQGTVRDGLPVASVGSVGRPVAVADPAVARLTIIDRLGGLTAAWWQVQGAATYISDLFGEVLGDMSLTDDELAHIGSAGVPESVVRAMTTLEKALVPTKARGTGSATSTGAAVDTAARDAWWTTPGAIGQAPAGRGTVRIIEGSISDGGHIVGKFHVTRADGAEQTFTSPTAAAQFVNGGGSVNGRTYYRHVTEAPAVDPTPTDDAVEVTPAP